VSDDETKESGSDDANAGSGGADDEANAETKVAKPSRRKRRSQPAEGTTTAAEVSSKHDDAEDTEGAETSEGKTEADAGPRRDLPKWNRARVKRKAPKGEEQDAFQMSVRKAGRGLMERPWAVIGLIVAVAGVGAGVYAWFGHGESQRASATTILATAAAYEARGQVIEDLAEQTVDRVRPLPQPIVQSEDELRQTVDDALSDLEAEAPDTPANELADLMRAARLARASDFEGAEAAYRGFLKRQPGHALVFLAREGLVLTLEAQERWDDALTEVETFLGEEGDFYRDQALWHQGRLLEGAERADEALAVYKQYMAEYPLDQASLAADGVRARLEALEPGSVPPLPSRGMPDLSGLGGFGP